MVESTRHDRHDHLDRGVHGVDGHLPGAEHVLGREHGFKLRDAGEDSAASPEQPLRSKEAASTPPELVATFG